MLLVLKPVLENGYIMSIDWAWAAFGKVARSYWDCTYSPLFELHVIKELTAD